MTHGGNAPKMIMRTHILSCKLCKRPPTDLLLFCGVLYELLQTREIDWIIMLDLLKMNAF
jgi:hypothetical protein